MKKNSKLIFLICLFCLIMSTSCRTEKNEGINSNEINENITIKSIDNNIIKDASEIVLSIPIDYSFYLKNDRFPEAFSVYKEIFFIIDTQKSSILKYKNGELVSKLELSYPFSDMIDIYAINENDYYIFNYPLERGIYFFKDKKQTKIESDLNNYNKFTKIGVYGDKLLIGDGGEYLDLKDGFESVQKNPWNIEREEQYLIDLDSGKKYNVFSKNNVANILGKYSNYIFIEEYLDFDNINNRKRFIKILSTENNDVLSIEIQNNEQSINRDLLIDKELNIFQMVFTNNALNIKKINMKKLGIN